MLSKRPFSIHPLSVHGQFGLERENLRIDANGALALTPHPQAFGDKLTNPEITTDFSESQIELVTPVAPSIQKTLEHEERLTRKVFTSINSELLWPLSSPPTHLPPEDQIPIADFGLEGKEKTDYRIYLSNKYGRRKQLYCGIHFNCSFADDLFVSQDERNRFYLNLVSQALRHRYFLVHLLAASPEKIGEVCYRSARLSVHGYKNDQPVYPDYSSPNAYIHSLRAAVKNGAIESPRELYQLVRIKGEGFEDLVDDPNATRVEVRIPDLNPLFHTGINPSDLYLMHLYLLWCSQNETHAFTMPEQKEANALSDEAAMLNVSPAFADKMNVLFDVLQAFVEQQELPDVYEQALNQAEMRWRNPSMRYAEQVRDCLDADSEAAMNWARQMKHTYMHTCRSSQ